MEMKMRIRELTAIGLLLGAALFAELATPVELKEFYSKAGTQFKYKTEASVSHTDEALVFQVRCEQPKATLTAVARLQDRNVFTDDSIEVYIDAAREGKDYLQFIVNSLGTIQDLRFREYAWNSHATAIAEVLDNEWIVTLTVPFADIAPYFKHGQGDVTVNINIGRALHERTSTFVSILDDGGFGASKEKFIPLRITGVSAADMRKCYLAHLAKLGVDSSAFAALKDKEFYEAGEKAIREQLTHGRKVLAEGELYAFDYPTNVIPNPRFEYLDRRGRIANWLKRGEGDYLYKDDALEMRSEKLLELWQENMPFLDNTRIYSLHGRIKSISGKNRFQVNLVGLDRSVKAKEIVVNTLESPVFANTGEWQDVTFDFSLPKSAFRGEIGILAEGGTLLVESVELDLLGKEDAEIIINQLGYRPDGYKDAIIWSRKGGLDENYELWEGETCAYRGKATRLPEKHYGREVLIADFSAFKREGVYRVKSNGMVSHPFKLGATVYEEGIRLLTDGLYLQRQGVRQEGWKQKPDYMDDAYIVEKAARDKDGQLYLPDGRLNPKVILGHRDLTGGWRDAGDDSKQGRSSSTINALARVLWSVGGKHPLSARLADELQWGVDRYANKLYMGDGTFLYPTVSVTKKSYWYGRAPDACTDGIPGTEDDRYATAIRTENGYTGDTGNQWVFYECLAMSALALREINPEESRKCTEIMKAYLEKLRQLYAEYDMDKHGYGDYYQYTRCAAKRAYVALYLSRLTGEDAYKAEAEHILRRTIDLVMKLDFAAYDKHRSYFATMHYFNVMLEYAELFPNEPLTAELKPAIQRYLDGLLLPGYDQSELFPVFDHRRLCQHYKQKCKAIAVTAESTYNAWTLLRAGRILGTTDYTVLAEKTLQYWMGRNPQNICEVSGVGWRFVAVMSGLTWCPGHEDGVIKGMMANGFRYLAYMPILSKPVNCYPGGTISTNYGCEVYQVPNAYTIMLLGELDRKPLAGGVK